MKDEKRRKTGAGNRIDIEKEKQRKADIKKGRHQKKRQQETSERQREHKMRETKSIKSVRRRGNEKSTEAEMAGKQETGKQVTEK